MKIFTIGHSTRSEKEFLDVLKYYGIEAVVDIRRFPVSKHHPHFNKEELEKILTENSIDYFWLENLGGYRKGGYEKYMKSKEFVEGLEKLENLAKQKKTTFMCAERDWYRCHRRYIASLLVQQGWNVVHVINKKEALLHMIGSRTIKEKMNLKVFCEKK